MRSVTPLTDDRTARARVRDAAIECYARLGVQATTARKVAAAAGVSPGLVIHHFGSMDGLRLACDEHVAAVIRNKKHEAIAAGLAIDVASTLRDVESTHAAAYLAKVLVDDSPAVAKLVDELVADAEGYIEEGVDSGILKPTADARGRAAVLAIWSMGALVLHEHVKRLLGVDVINADEPAAMAAYAGPAYDILSDGIFTEAFAAHMKSAFSETASSKGTP